LASYEIVIERIDPVCETRVVSALRCRYFVAHYSDVPIAVASLHFFGACVFYLEQV
jgi:hypothetical protein